MVGKPNLDLSVGDLTPVEPLVDLFAQPLRRYRYLTGSRCRLRRLRPDTLYPALLKVHIGPTSLIGEGCTVDEIFEAGCTRVALRISLGFEFFDRRKNRIRRGIGRIDGCDRLWGFGRCEQLIPLHPQKSDYGRK